MPKELKYDKKARHIIWIFWKNIDKCIYLRDSEKDQQKGIVIPVRDPRLKRKPQRYTR